jgi:hypothetical protein
MWAALTALLLVGCLVSLRLRPAGAAPLGVPEIAPATPRGPRIY